MSNCAFQHLMSVLKCFSELNVALANSWFECWFSDFLHFRGIFLLISIQSSNSTICSSLEYHRPIAKRFRPSLSLFPPRNNSKYFDLLNPATIFLRTAFAIIIIASKCQRICDQTSDEIYHGTNIIFSLFQYTEWTIHNNFKYEL